MSVVPYLAEETMSSFAALSRKDKQAVAQAILSGGVRLAKNAARAGRKGSRFIRKGTFSKKEARAQSARRSAPAAAVPRGPYVPTGMPPIDAPPAIAAPTAVATVMRQSYATSLQNYTVSHREYLGDLVGSTGFAVTSYSINAGRADVFPWLSKIALNFEMYSFRTLKFALKTQSPTTTRGSMILAIDYDPTDPAPDAKLDLLQYAGVTRSPPWSDCSFTASVKDMRRLPKYLVSAAPALVTSDQRLQDVGTLFIATQGQADTSTIAEIWCEYTVDLITPQSSSRCMQQYIEVNGRYGDNLNDTISINEDTMGQICSVSAALPSRYVVNVAGTYTLQIRVACSAMLDTPIGSTTFTINDVAKVDNGPFVNTDGTNFTAMVHYGRYRFAKGDIWYPTWTRSAEPASFTYTLMIQAYEPTPSTQPY